MSILKFENRTPRSLPEMYKYLTDPNKTDVNGLIGIGINPLYAVTEMQFIYQLYPGRTPIHPYVQAIFAFDLGVRADIPFLRQVCYDIGMALILEKRQIFGAIHYLGKASEKIHCHYLINYIGIYGTLYRQKHNIGFFRSRVNQVLYHYDLSPIYETPTAKI